MSDQQTTSGMTMAADATFGEPIELYTLRIQAEAHRRGLAEGFEAARERAVDVLAGDGVFHLPAKTFAGLDGDGMPPVCPEGDPPGAGWCQNAVDLVADTRYRALEAIRAMEPPA